MVTQQFVQYEYFQVYILHCVFCTNLYNMTKVCMRMAVLCKGREACCVEIKLNLFVIFSKVS